MAAPTDNKGLELAPDAGTPTGNLKFAVQAGATTGIIQKILFSALSFTTKITGLDLNSTTKWMTPNAFTLTTATESAYGTVRNASTADINGKTSTDVLTAEKMDDIFQTGMQQTGTIDQSDVDVGSTQGIVTITSVRGSTEGQMGFYQGTFDYNSDSNLEYKSLYFNNARQPLQRVGGAGTYIRSDKPLRRYPFNYIIEAAGSPVDGVGRIRMDIDTGIDGVNWDTSLTYTLDFTTRYFAII
jgi:hypothetical protein